MSKRTDRREAERVARKLAYQRFREQPPQQPRLDIPEPEPVVETEPFPAAESEPEPELTTPTISSAQLAANQANAQLSTGPISTAGKAKSSMNALKHGLTGKTVLLSTDDTAEYERRLNLYLAMFKPATEDELSLVQSIVDSKWRIDRLKALENGIFIKGSIEFANKFEDQPDGYRGALINVETYLKYEKSIRNLNIQEARLNRRIEKDQAELTRLQTIRKRDERLAAEQQQKAQAAPPSTYSAAANGFEFSTPGNHKPINQNLTPKPHKRAA